MALTCRIKICGIRTREALDAAAMAGADAVGFVFAEKSDRYLSADEAARLAAAAPPFIDLVGLFTDTPVDAIRKFAATVPLTTLQLHSDRYDAEAIAALAPLRVIRAVAFTADTAEHQLRQWEQHFRELPNLAGLIVDSPDPANIGGGTGEAFDWRKLRDLLDALRPTVPIILAGGLTSENVAAAIATVRPWAVDVSSGVESQRGVKDDDRIRSFCQAARAADQKLQITNHELP